MSAQVIGFTAHLHQRGDSGGMHRFRVTHVRQDGVRHRNVVCAANGERAGAWAEALYGPARALSCICVSRGAEAARV